MSQRFFCRKGEICDCTSRGVQFRPCRRNYRGKSIPAVTLIILAVWIVFIVSIGTLAGKL